MRQPLVNGKYCSKCSEPKLYSEFHKDKHKSDGCTSQCKTCKSEYDSKYRFDNLEKLTKQHADYRKKPKNKKKHALASAQWVADNPLKRKQQVREYCERNRKKLRERGK